MSCSVLQEVLIIHVKTMFHFGVYRVVQLVSLDCNKENIFVSFARSKSLT